MTNLYTVSKKIQEVRIGDVLSSPFNDFRVIEVHDGGKYIIIRVEQFGNPDENYFWDFKLGARVMVKELA